MTLTTTTSRIRVANFTVPVVAGLSVGGGLDIRGRMDTTAHPFTTTLGRDDVRITTRYVEDYFPSSAFSTIHECGHALYELGIDPAPEYRRTGLADASSMAVHESQSRMWENMVGRSRGFWAKHLPEFQRMLAPVLDGVDLNAFYKAVNRVEPSLIRTEADEVTYGLHIILRFELESDLVQNSRQPLQLLW